MSKQVYDRYPFIFCKLDDCFTFLIMIKSFLFKYCYKNKTKKNYIVHYYNSPYLLKHSTYKHVAQVKTINNKDVVYTVRLSFDYKLNKKTKEEKLLLYNRYNIIKLLMNKDDFDHIDIPFFHMRIFNFKGRYNFHFNITLS